MIRVAAVGDIHVGPECARAVAAALRRGGRARRRAPARRRPDPVRRAGRGRGAGRRAARRAASRWSPCSATTTSTPTPASEVVAVLEQAGVHVLDGTRHRRRRRRRVRRHRRDEGLRRRVPRRVGLGVRRAGDEGVHAPRPRRRLRAPGRARRAGHRRAHRPRLHYAPVEETLRGERLEIYPFLGCWLLAEAIDDAGADVAFHGHAHRGAERGVTPGGVRVRNVAQPVLGAPLPGLRHRAEAGRLAGHDAGRRARGGGAVKEQLRPSRSPLRRSQPPSGCAHPLASCEPCRTSSSSGSRWRSSRCAWPTCAVSTASCGRPRRPKRSTRWRHDRRQRHRPRPRHGPRRLPRAALLFPEKF